MARLSSRRSWWRKKRETKEFNYEVGGEKFIITRRRSAKNLKLPHTPAKVPISPIIFSVYTEAGKEVGRVTGYRYPTREAKTAIFIPRIDVHKDFRKRNIGRFLVKLTKDNMSKENIKMRIKSEPEAVKFWESLGFEAKEKKYDPLMKMELTAMELSEDKKIPLDKSWIKKKN